MSGFGVLGEQEAESLHAKFNAIPDKAKRLLSIDKGHLISQLRHTTLQPSHSRVKEKKKKNTVHPETCVYPALYLYSSPPVSKKTSANRNSKYHLSPSVFSFQFGLKNCSWGRKSAIVKTSSKGGPWP